MIFIMMCGVYAEDDYDRPSDYGTVCVFPKDVTLKPNGNAPRIVSAWSPFVIIHYKVGEGYSDCLNRGGFTLGGAALNGLSDSFKPIGNETLEKIIGSLQGLGVLPESIWFVRENNANPGATWETWRLVCNDQEDGNQVFQAWNTRPANDMTSGVESFLATCKQEGYKDSVATDILKQMKDFIEQEANKAQSLKSGFVLSGAGLQG